MAENDTLNILAFITSNIQIIINTTSFHPYQNRFIHIPSSTTNSNKGFYIIKQIAVIDGYSNISKLLTSRKLYK